MRYGDQIREMIQTWETLSRQAILTGELDRAAQLLMRCAVARQLLGMILETS